MQITKIKESSLVGKSCWEFTENAPRWAIQKAMGASYQPICLDAARNGLLDLAPYYIELNWQNMEADRIRALKKHAHTHKRGFNGVIYPP